MYHFRTWQENLALTPHDNTCVPTPSLTVFQRAALGLGQGSPAEPAALSASLNFWWPYIATHGSSNNLRLHQTMSLTLGTTMQLEATCRGSTRRPMAEQGLWSLLSLDWDYVAFMLGQSNLRHIWQLWCPTWDLSCFALNIFFVTLTRQFNCSKCFLLRKWLHRCTAHHRQPTSARGNKAYPKLPPTTIQEGCVVYGPW